METIMKSDTSTRPRCHHLRVITGLLVFAVLVAPTALAERPQERRADDAQMGEKLHERMTELRVRILTKRVGLDADRVDEVEAILQKGDLERKGLHRAMRESHGKLRQLIEADADDGPSYETAVGTLLKSRQRLHELQYGELQKLRSLLSSKEMGKLVMALHRLKKRMRRLHEGARGGPEMEEGPRGKERRGRRGKGRRGRRGGAW